MRRYTSLPAFTLPKAAQGFKSCEMTMGRRNVHACHAGALVHSLEGWKHHEVRSVLSLRASSAALLLLREGHAPSVGSCLWALLDGGRKGD